jgi:SAM-dependent methyltransferase
MQRLHADDIVWSIVRRLVNPLHLFRALRLHATRQPARRFRDDPFLKYCAGIVPGDFLHYGFFTDPQIQPEDVSINDIARAQLRYAELLVEQIADRESPVLDVGCGMGGLVGVLLRESLVPVALTPDATQCGYIRQKYPDVPLISEKFERMPLRDNRERFGTVITSESLQYLKLDRALPRMGAILKPGGRWIVCDYFRRKPSAGASGHVWDDFTARLSDGGWSITHERDITPHVVPTLRCAYMWCERLGRPLLDYATHQLRRKTPGVHYILGHAIEGVESIVDRTMETQHPEQFAETWKYMLLVIQREGGATGAPALDS